MQGVGSVFTHTQPATAVDGIVPWNRFSAFPVDPYLERRCAYLAHLYPDTQDKTYTYKGSGKIEFQLTYCLRYAFDFCTCCQPL